MKPTSAFVAELVRDMYNVHYARKSGAGGLDYIQHVIVETPTYRGGCGTSWKPWGGSSRKSSVRYEPLGDRKEGIEAGDKKKGFRALKGLIVKG